MMCVLSDESGKNIIRGILLLERERMYNTNTPPPDRLVSRRVYFVAARFAF
jgi:hypothetical protein